MPSQPDAQDVPLLTTKLYVPRPHPNLVPRPPLIQQLDQGLRLGHRLTLVSAPAGFGKTTLIAEWLQHLRATPAPGPASSTDHAGGKTQAGQPACDLAWLSLDADDNDPARFMAYFIAALETIQADAGTGMRVLFNSPQTPPLKSVLTTLINSLATLSTGLVLVLDDYHVIEHQSIHDALVFLVEHLPSQLHLVILSRMDPPFPLARLRSRGQLTELRAADLRFTPDEATTFLNEAMGLDLSPGDVAALGARTEGWISGLQLAALSMRDKVRERVAGFIADFGGSHRHVIDYLAEEVLALQTEEIHDFLCQTAILDQLTAPLCDAVTGRQDSDVVLERLEKSNLFLVPLDDERRWYRYHRLFADFLRHHLHQDMPERERDLHRRAAQWYEDRGSIAQAVGHTLQAADLEWAARLIEQTALKILMRSQAATLLHWLDSLPDALIDSRPRLCVIYAEALVVAGQLEPAETYLQRAEENLQADTPVTGNEDLLSQICAIRAYLCTYQGELARGIRLARQALQQLPDENVFTRSIVTWLLAFIQLFSEDTPAARRALAKTIELSQVSGNTLMASLSLYTSGWLQALQGHLSQAHKIFRQGVQFIETDSGQPATGWSELPFPGISLMYQGLGDIARERNDLEAADHYLTRSVEVARQWGNAEVLVDSYDFLARVKQAQGDMDSALDAASRATQLARENLVSPLTARQAEAHRARMWVAQGNLEAAARWAASLDHTAEANDDDLRIILYPRWIEQSALVRLLIAQGRSDEATRLLQPMLREAEAAGWVGIVIEILALRALALQEQGQTAEALTALERALALAEPEGYVRAFVDLGAPIAELLRLSLSAGVLPGYVSTLLVAFDGERKNERRTTKAAVPSSALRRSSLAEPLTERELEVLGLVAAGLSNREIADQLTITVGTAKRHVANVYAKLDAHSRVQAVARAQDHHLL